jgi:hypothetical protein
MLTSARLPLGAPGIYALPDYVAPRLSPQRMDVCAFVGVAPRGPAYVPEVNEQYPPGYRMMTEVARPRRRSVAIPVKSFDDYRRLFGAFEGPGLLPYAVASFFEQGGQRAYIVRIVHAHDKSMADGETPQPPNLAGLSLGVLDGPFTQTLKFFSRNEGSWGDSLHVEMGFSTQSLIFVSGPDNTVLLNNAHLISAGTLLRFTDSTGVEELVYCRGLQQIRDPAGPFSHWQLQLDAPLTLLPLKADVIEAWISVRDDKGRVETFQHLALNPDHPRSLASVLCNESTLIWPHFDWAGVELTPVSTRVELLRATSTPFSGGFDGYASLLHEDFFDAFWSAADENSGAGITALAGLHDVTHLLVPDLYVPAQWPGDETTVETRIDEAGAEFGPCVRSQSSVSASNTPPSALSGLILDPRRTDELLEIAALQNLIVDFCERTQGIVSLIDVPPGLSQGQAERWRAHFDSSWCAAYHPWLIASRCSLSSDAECIGTLRPMPPSAVAAGIIARKELRRGIQFGPANEIASEIIKLAEKLPDGRVDIFHPQGMNCFVREADGIYLVSARTLSRNAQWRQLSVRRLILMLRRVLLRETQWAVFEPNGPKLWRDLSHAIENLLRRLFRAGVFGGATERESFFVRILNDQRLLDRGELIIEIGVAPAEPMEFIFIQLRRDGDGTLMLEES